MTDAKSLRLILPRQIRELPADLVVVLIVVAATNAASLLPVVRETPIRIPLGLVFLLFLPGYAFVAALFPECKRASNRDETVRESDKANHRRSPTDSLQLRINGIERIVLSIGLSVAIVGLFGLVLNVTPWGIRLVPVTFTVSGFTLVLAGIAAIRRWNLPPEKRFRVPYREWYAASRVESLAPSTHAETALNVLVVIAILVAASSVGYAVITPTQSEQFSEVYILTENDGELVADDYPLEFKRGEGKELVVGINNHEHQMVDYTVIIVEQEVETDGDETVVEEQRKLDQFETQLPHDETWRFRYDLEPTMTGEDIRIAWLVYQGEVPPEPSVENAAYDTHLWVNTSR